MLEIDTIYQGDCLDMMKNIEDKSINCIITSPPYWGLRDYKTENIIWDGDPECPHNFLSDGAYPDNMRYRVGKTSTVGNNINPDIYTIKKSGEPNAKNDKARFESFSQFCSLCGAWKGSLGLEPIFELYINHLCSIFDECKRMLKDDGTLWINLGDTYASNGSQETRFWHGNNPGKHRFNGDGELSKGYSGRCRTNEITSKSLCDIPFRFSIAMIDNGWIKRNTIIWHKPNVMPASCKDRFTVDFEYVFFFTKNKDYYFEQQFEPLADATIPRMLRGVSENNKWVNGADGQTKHTMSQPRPNRKMAGTLYGGDGSGLHEHSGYYDKDGTPRFYPQGRNQRCVWSIPTKPFSEAHFATFPEKLIEPMIKAGCPEGGIVYDPFIGAGTVAVVAKKLNRHYLGSELNADYIDIANKRIEAEKQQLTMVL